MQGLKAGGLKEGDVTEGKDIRKVLSRIDENITDALKVKLKMRRRN